MYYYTSISISNDMNRNSCVIWTDHTQTEVLRLLSDAVTVETVNNDSEWAAAMAVRVIDNGEWGGWQYTVTDETVK